MKYILGSVRILLIILYTFCLLIFLWLETLFKGKSFDIGFRYSKIWGQGICKIVGLQIEVEGSIPDGDMILMPNHRSYSDIFVFISMVKSSFVSKAELRKWPMIGYAADLVGTMFVNRSSPESRKKTIRDMKERLSRAYAVTIFPEGTTFMGPELKEYKKGTFMMAAEEGFTIVPAAIEYKNPDNAWVGADTFIPHFLRTFGKPFTRVKVRFGERMHGDSWEKLLADAHTWTLKNVGELRKEWDNPA